MEWTVLLLIFFIALIVLFVFGIPVAFSFWLLNLAGFFFFMGGVSGMPALITSLRSSMASFTLTAVPFFILMGDVLFRAGIATRMLDVMEMWLGRLPGRLSLVTVATGGLLGALSGSSLGVTGMMTTMLTPDMRGRGYNPHMITGPIMAGGSLAVIIPPSILVIILAGLAEVSAGKLLIAGVIPGLVMAIGFASYIVVRCVRNPSLAPSAPDKTDITLSQKLQVTVISAVPAAFILFLVLGTIFLGMATPTEAAAGGAFGAFILTAVYRKLSLKLIKECIMSCVRITGLTLIIGTGSIAFSQLLGFTGVTRGIMGVALDLQLHPIFIVCATLVILIILGCFIDQISMLMIGVPIFMPVIVALGYDPLWYGLLFIIAITIGYITPPFGMLFFVVKGVVPDISMGTIYRSAYPYLVLDIIVIILCIILPEIITWLPGLM